MTKSRNYSLDIVRIFAFFSVICVHFFLNTNFYYEPMSGAKMYVMCIMRTFFMICVPLFVTLTGYLMSSKKLSAKYYIGIVKTLGIYLLASIAAIIYKNAVLGYGLTFQDSILGILDFTASNYSWYIEMYIGLFLLAPFINLMYNGLNTQKAKLILILTLIFITSLPTVLNIYNFKVDGWWETPYISFQYQKLIPHWWTKLYPLTYYFIGAYLKEYPIKLKKIFCLLLSILIAVAFGSFLFYRYHDFHFVFEEFSEYQSLPVLFITIFVFSFFSQIKTDNLPKFAKSSLKFVSDITLGAYLLSFIADLTIYEHLKNHVPSLSDQFNWYIPTVLTIAIISLAGSAILNLTWMLLSKLAKFIVSKIPKRTQKNSNIEPI